jgi:hypothetical protein
VTEVEAFNYVMYLLCEVREIKYTYIDPSRINYDSDFNCYPLLLNSKFATFTVLHVF